MSDHEPLVLFSANTLIAFRINERFYGGRHYVWCADTCDGWELSAHQFANPPSSCPADICRTLLEDVARGDRHSKAIEDNRRGIQRGIAARLADGAIGQREADRIEEMVALADLTQFMPLVYVIPWTGVAAIAQDVAIGDLAHPLSVEYVIDSLPRALFRVINPERFRR